MKESVKMEVHNLIRKAGSVNELKGFWVIMYNIVELKMLSLAITEIE
ncbi:MAG: hypothetical protein HQK88_03150 [Nitrospirae bacterium]|nr:hypothetical protein [Nitrospirota bacterium]MBF0536269.1 hypothetical protein [Nitrospirota bacterium]MBF0615797.1 hypothetical protein [Nitrospirota bacterium]